MYFNSRCKLYALGVFLASSSVSHAGVMGTVSEDKGFYFNVTPIYGAISDSAIDKFPFVETINASNNITSHTSDIDSRWGYSLSLGYLFGPEKSHDVVLSYTNLTNRGSTNVVNVNPNDILINKVSQILKSEDSFVDPNQQVGGLDLYGPAFSYFSGSYEFQTADLITHRYFKSTFINNVQFSRYYGVKATELKKGFYAQYIGMGISRIQQFPFTESLEPVNDQINYEAKYYGIGPRIGMGADWSLTRYISLMGDVSASLLGGSYDTRFLETLVTPMQIPGIRRTGSYSFSQNTDTSLWAAGVLGANLGIAANFDMKNDSRVGIAGGISSEQYWTEATPDYFSSKTARNRVSLNQRFSVRNLFIKLSYVC
ncbi:Lpg1974 family pore-forming outer membrane protein [Legionella pneumophila]|uniref:Uncharacterized protein n=1 Tax=Legionella pneumophila subsp. pascullei TaxID=91890 RepID=A0AAX2J0Q5_LEGPN|nr:Lpg1974 family pore-forming outer membrane protein [Legionella pneumophila]AMP90880.1 hypothetical protein AXF35_14750 [Legionella pneumophila subsp. pascullei]AMP93865.1 hypothetical protein AXF36_15115 [Legionella pneumophila subsp. pascullei]AMP96782.1 hypothetical protein AXF37_14750 [Legionella pneumophila subsp. pascullei]SQG91837.1 Uncharacterised protein [Legionella pneumophila subsp. pascullei]VEH08383.1 Uncharacterised protein [Legionella pneumophila subsp. pascullei]